MTCNHSESKYTKVHKYNDPETGEPIYEDEWVTKRTFIDVDLHRYRCWKCNEIFYYSERARRHYEEGTGELDL